MFRRIRPPPRSLRLPQAMACAPIVPLPGAAICSPIRRAYWSSTSDAVNRLNRIDEAVTFATLPAYKPVVEGEMIATVKIIPFAVAACGARQCGGRSGQGQAGYPHRALQGRKDRHRLDIAAGAGAEGGRQNAEDHRRAHRADRCVPSLLKSACRTSRQRWRAPSTRCCAAGAELVIVFGASAIADRRDVIPMAIESAGGAIEHFGMPVDPGNLMLIGRLRGQAIIGAPGCAR